MPNERIVVIGVIQGYRIREGSTEHYEDLRDAFSVEDKSYVVFSEPYEKVKAALDDGDLKEFVRDHTKQSFANFDSVHEEVMDALNQELDDDFEYVPANDYWRLQCVQAVRKYCCATLAEEFIEYIEQQGGYGYWKQFNSIPEVIANIDSYVDNKEDQQP